MSKFENDTQRGYAACEAGLPFEEKETPDWQNGWTTCRDFRWWKRVAKGLGGELHGFSYRYAGSILIENELHSVSGSLLTSILRLLGIPRD